MDIFKKLFESSNFSLSDVDKIVDNSDKIVQTALAMSQDGAKAVVILCLSLAKMCADTKIPVKVMIESILEMEETFLGIDDIKGADILNN